MNLAPTSTGSATAIALIFPELKGKLNGESAPQLLFGASSPAREFATFVYVEWFCAEPCPVQSQLCPLLSDVWRQPYDSAILLNQHKATGVLLAWLQHSQQQSAMGHFSAEHSKCLGPLIPV
jgi:hypothetical protein